MEYETVDNALAALDLVLKMTDTVYNAIDIILQEESTDSEGKKDRKVDSETQDKYNFSYWVVDNGILDIFTGILCVAAAMGGGIAAGTVQIKGDGSIMLKSSKVQTSATILQTQVNGPTPAIGWAANVAAMVKPTSNLVSVTLDNTRLMLALKGKYDPQARETL
jgi:hypothetical protein